MSTFSFNTAAGNTIEREKLIAYLNTAGASATSPVWSPLGLRVEDSSEEMDWSVETKQDILGHTHSKLKKPIISQSFEPCDLDAGDVAQKYLWDLAVVQQNYPKLSALDMLIVHLYTTDGDTTSPASFAERYDACMVEATGLGGEGGGNIGMPINVTYGGKRTTGTATVSAAGVVTFTADT